METAISIPDTTFEKVEQRATALGVSRSEFYTRAAQRYLADLGTQDLSEEIDDVLARIQGEDSSTLVVRAGHRSIAELSGAW
ncbi:hypothetical protein [Saccharomonospora halophila]|uniref:hypothetical protein n=1 Tax=Saccharomonospora halophila TaxID=129922 RepID=UPI0003648296|nr:hypothetical protein [Saccharomonospora halophila]